mmetsp:Transcript_16142/g.41944  ORF Transcript_16142/g.41944 Transcript_16142/m.41944 type:complete len:245 (+) Transcript_16142:133-867(+)
MWLGDTEHVRASLQLSVVVGIASLTIALGYGPVTNAFGPAGAETWLTAGEFGAVSALLSAQPLTGDTLKLGLQDVLGTLAGGSVGFVLYLSGATHVLVSTRVYNVSSSLRAVCTRTCRSVRATCPEPPLIKRLTDAACRVFPSYRADGVRGHTYRMLRAAAAVQGSRLGVRRGRGRHDRRRHVHPGVCQYQHHHHPNHDRRARGRHPRGRPHKLFSQLLLLPSLWQQQGGRAPPAVAGGAGRVW